MTGFCVALIYYGDIGGPGGGEVRGGEDAWRVLDWKRGVFTTGMIVGGSAAVTEALGESFCPVSLSLALPGTLADRLACSTLTDVGSLDDNLTLPIVSGGLVWAFLALTSSLL